MSEMIEVPRELLAELAPAEPISQDELGGCVWCGMGPGPTGYEQATADPSSHTSDCPWLAARRLLDSDTAETAEPEPLVLPDPPVAITRYRVGEHVIAVRSTHWRTAYPRNGNVGNPTVYRQWDAYLDGTWVAHSFSTRWEAYEQARVRIDPDLGIRQHTVVKAEMVAARIKNGDRR